MIKKIIFITLGILIVYLGILLVEFQYAWIIKGDLDYFFKKEIFIEPIPHAFLAIIVALAFAYITRKKK
ncbi:hypothetical protein QAZ01_11020 [Glaesserella parasuis]|uniref:hypothetical protein n=1 Tax=Glaesserella parasuis TaxID=738 RepID=UPI00094FC2B2|nr:hypothetical protein [Glaesserella parasuis]MDG6232132.1 hypothetical protein [Glaesserella parasuis]MDG6310874.1 hypothetical protein [Glaesserella parasuis]MDG6410004.1 hypothetical protein [Glaesserella parasuis]MDG6451461.1 hypothetical protein [Glaesserella parasuis]MDO9781805.1 hypothetical protein [Glaesserella parasuis]